MSLFVETKLASKLGETAIAVTSAEHISATLKANIRGTVYDVHGHYFKLGAVWQFRNEADLSVRRAWNGKAGDFNRVAAPTHVAAIRAELERVLDEYVQSNPRDLVEAEIKRLDMAIAGGEADVEKARKALDDAEIKLVHFRGLRRQIEVAKESQQP